MLMIKKFRCTLFVFITHRGICPTNSGSEQALRPCIVFHKVTNGFRSRWGADLYTAVRSVVGPSGHAAGGQPPDEEASAPSKPSDSPSKGSRCPLPRERGLVVGVSNNSPRRG